MLNNFRTSLIMIIVIILLSSVAPRPPPCSSCSFDFGPDSPGDGDVDDDDNHDDDHDDHDDNHDDPDDITFILLIVAESPSGLLLRLAASSRSSSGSGSIWASGLLFRPW